MNNHLKLATLLLICFFLAIPSFSQHGKVIEGLQIRSDVLGKEVRYAIYLPYDYELSERYYPVVYLLHGYTDDESAWIQFGEVNLAADQAIRTREIPPMIIVMPDAGVTWYINNYDSSVRYEDFFFQEFIPHIEDNYRIRKKKEFRGVAGLSMGGYGSLIYALRHPYMFTACAPFSAAIRTEAEVINQTGERWDRVEGSVFGPGLKGESRITEHWKAYNPIHIVTQSDPDRIMQVKYYLDCGDDDFLYRGNAEFHILLKDKGIPHEYRVRDGSHTWEYWRTGIIDGLKFISESFHR
jgi:enterochelin esterase-like enzyme